MQPSRDNSQERQRLELWLRRAEDTSAKSPEGIRLERLQETVTRALSHLPTEFVQRRSARRARRHLGEMASRTE